MRHVNAGTPSACAAVREGAAGGRKVFKCDLERHAVLLGNAMRAGYTSVEEWRAHLDAQNDEFWGKMMAGELDA